MMRIRGVLKVVFLAMLTNQVLTVVFTVIARHIDPDVSPEAIQLFSFVSAMLAGFWVQADAKQAFLNAQKDGYIVLRLTPEPSVVVKENCPKRWLVQLYLELNPSLVRH
ncbi:hypothetical protein [Trinickia fusca]|nr:hypothetical protein [Trinickia fusca]